MKKHLLIFVALFLFAAAVNSQVKQWSCSTSIENLDIQYNAVTVDNIVDCYYITVGGIVPSGWTASIEGDNYVGETFVNMEYEALMYEPTEEFSFVVTLDGPQYTVTLVMYLYYDGEQFQLDVVEF
jgi:hypothetical protein